VHEGQVTQVAKRVEQAPTRRPGSEEAVRERLLEETVEEMRKELAGLRIAVNKNTEVFTEKLLLTQPVVTQPQTGLGSGNVEFLMSAEAVHNRAHPVA